MANFIGGSKIDNFFGTDDDDFIDGGANHDFLVGGLGNDHIEGGSGNDTIYGDNFGQGQGEPEFCGPSLVVNGSFEAPDQPANTWSVYGSILGWESDIGPGIEIQDNVVMASSDGQQHVELDSHFAGDGLNNSNMWQDIVTGGTGPFKLELDYSPRPGVSTESNQVQVWWNGVLIDTLSGNVAGWTTHTYIVNGGGATTRLEFRAVGTTDTLGGFIDDVKVFKGKVDEDEGGNDLINGGSGDDTIYGQAGNDTIDGGSGNDYIEGGSGNDNIVGGIAGDDEIYGGDGNDNINGASGNDLLVGGAGNDVIIGGAGSGVDTMVGGLGADTLTGNSGGDFFVYNSLAESTTISRDIITDWQGIDFIDVGGLGFTGVAAGAAVGSTLGYTYVGGNTIITAAGSDFSIQLNGVQALNNGDFIFV